MGRIEEALKRSRDSNKRAIRDENHSPVPIAEGINTLTHNIAVSELPVIVPDEEALEAYRVVAAQKDAPQRSAYKVLRTRILQRLRASQFNVIGITGPGPGEGKTITAINLAYSLAQHVSHQVILADLDLRRPSIHRYLGITPRHDLGDVLDGSSTLKDALVCPNANRLAVLTCQTPRRDSSEILSSPEMVELVEQFKGLGKKTITILDLPPVLAGDDVIAFTPLINALLLVVGQATCRREDLIETQELLKDAEILGIILNRAQEKSAASGYYDYY